MSVVVDCVVPAEDFELGRALRETGYARAELEGVVAAGPGAGAGAGRVAPFLRVVDAESGAVEAALRRAEHVTGVGVLDEFNGRALFRVEWALEGSGFVRRLLDLDVAIVEAVGGADRWRFELRFHTDDALSAFQAYRRAGESNIDVQRVTDLAEWETEHPVDAMGLTPAQNEALLAAFNDGYFAVPRGTNLIALSEQLGISSQSLSERLRRGEGKLVAGTLVTAPAPGPDFDPDPDSDTGFDSD
jgi:predicted DNA binding protein